MKASSLIYKKAIPAASAIAVSAALAIGMVGCAPSGDQASSSASENTASSQAASSDDGEDATEDNSDDKSDNSDSVVVENPISQDVEITQDQALKSALSHAGLKESEVQIVKNTLDIDDGRAMYEIEFIGPKNTEYEFEIDANTGDILSFESEPVNS